MRFRKRVKLFPGFHLNFSNSGISSSVGVKGASLSFSKRGTYLNLGIPGTGLSHRQKLSPPTASAPSISNYNFANNVPSTQVTQHSIELEGEIKSAERNTLTSASMAELQDTIREVHKSREETLQEINETEKKLKTARTIKLIANLLIVGFVVKWFRSQVYDKEDYIIDLKTQLSTMQVDIDIELTDSIKEKYKKLKDAFDALSKSAGLWDITAQVDNDRSVTRSAANATISRREVKFKYDEVDLIKCQFSALHLQNANGDDIYLFPAFAMITKNKKDFALIDIADIDMKFVDVQFIERDAIPSDTKTVGQTWAKVNKDGRPDQRFKGNYRIPIVQYGEIDIKTTSGLNESYCISNYQSTLDFVNAFNEYKQAVTSGT